MPLHSRSADADGDDELSFRPQFCQHGEVGEVPRLRLAHKGMPPPTAFQIIHDELMLDGNARLNLATFVTTWMEPQAELLMAECASKNMIDKDEYPQTAEIERRCVSILARLWNAEGADATGCSTTGSSEACMLGGLALKWRWRQRRAAAGIGDGSPESRHGRERPGLLGEVLPLLRRRASPGPRRARDHLPHRRGRRRRLRREHDRRRGRPRLDLRRRLRAGGGDRRSPRRPRLGRGPGRADARRRGLRWLRGSVSRPETRAGTSGSRGCSPSTSPATSSGSSIPASAGSCGATPRPCPTSSCSRSTTSAARCRHSP